MEEVDDFEADLEAEDVGSFAVPFDFLGVEELVLESIPMPTPMSLCEEDNFINPRASLFYLRFIEIILIRDRGGRGSSRVLRND